MAGGSEKGIRGEDPMRLCPECRMPISILANRCRYCGSIVGKPRKEVETLTVQEHPLFEHLDSELPRLRGGECPSINCRMAMVVPFLIACFR